VDLAIGRTAAPEELGDALRALLPGVRVHVTGNSDLSGVPHFDLLVRAMPTTAQDFPTGMDVSVAMSPGHDLGDWLCDLAAELSVSLCTRVICDGSRYGDDSSPYWSLVWDMGRALLADDSQTDIGDGEGGAVRIVRALDLPPHGRPSLASRVAPTGSG
jgi:hypothetical protein